MSILGEITLSSEASCKTRFLYPIPGPLIPLLYTLNEFICLCFILLLLICADMFFLKGSIWTVLRTCSLIAVTVAAILFCNNNAHEDTMLFCDEMVS